MKCWRPSYKQISAFYAIYLVAGIVTNFAIWQVRPSDVSTTQKRTVLSPQGVACNSSSQCPNGQCLADGPSYACKCNAGWIDKDGEQCSYQQKDKLTAFLLSFFLFTFGAGYFYLAAGSCCYICMGVANLLTFGMVGIWGTVVWILILCDALPDGNGIPLKPWA